jgi:hypothetical protein
MRRRVRKVLALLVGVLALVVVSLVIRAKWISLRSLRSIRVFAAGAAVMLAQPASAFASQDADTPAGTTDGESPTEPYPWSVGARAFIAPTVGIGGMGVALDVTYSVLPYLAVGAQHLVFVVDQGADPQYCERCIRSGNATFVFAEGRYWSRGWVTPYARIGAGLSHLHGQRVQHELDYTEDDLGVLAEAGIEWHYRFLSLRTFAFDQVILGSELDQDPFLALGAQLGARF